MTTKQQTTTVPVVEIGDVDPMSVAARETHGVEPCLARDPRRFECTRAAGHAESTSKSDSQRFHPSRLHVACGTNGRALAVWS